MSGKLSALVLTENLLILAVLAVVVGFSLVIALLFVNIARRKQAEQELHRYRDNQEERMTARTSELGQANTRLQQEIAERKHAEDAFWLNEARLRRIIDLVPHRIFVNSRDGRFLLVNRAMADAYHATPETMVGKHYNEFEANSLQYRNDRKVIDSQQPSFLPEAPLTLPDGTVRFFQITKVPYMVSGSAEPAVLGIAIDISERKQIEDTLTEERMLLRTVINNLPDYIYVKDAEGCYIVNNLAHAHALGVSEPDELIGKIESEVVPKEATESRRIGDQAIMLSGQAVFNEEEWIINADNRKQWLLSSRVPLRDTHGAVIGLVGISRDNTERRLADEAYQQHTRELNLLNHMGNLLQACKTEDDAYSVMGSICKLLFPLDAGSLGIMSGSRSQLKVVVSWGNPPSETEVFDVNDCWAFRLDTTHYIEHPDTGLLCTHLDVLPEDGYLCAPISTVDEVLGLFHLRFGHFDPAYAGDELKRMKDAKRMMVNRVVRHYALFITNLRLRETLKRESIRDPLTGLYNRRHMEASLERETSRVERLHISLGLIMFDVDHFKHFNDTFGHDAGDLVLREIGDVVKSYVRKEDIACRYGGEEFLLILPDMSPEGLKVRAEDIRQNVKKIKIVYQGKDLAVTISLGVAIFPQHGPTIEDAMKAADDALYQAKADGRDRAIMAAI